MKVLTAEQIRALDQLTITRQAISSNDLMERASRVLSDWLQELYPDTTQSFTFFCGSGNNGGDGLAVARMLYEAAYPVSVYCCEIGTESEDRKINRERLAAKGVVSLSFLRQEDPLPKVQENSIVVDALFGSGLSRPLQGYWARLVSYLNQQPNTCVAIDIPSGVFADQPTTGISIHARYTLSLELPKLALLMPENQDRVGEWSVRSIGLDQQGIAEADSTLFVLTDPFMASQLYKRKRFDHKGTFGHCLLVAGSYGKIGAAVLSARAAFRAGAGLVSVHTARCGYEIMQSTIPEAMVSVDDHQEVFTAIGSLSSYAAIGVGPGLGKDQRTVKALEDLIHRANNALVLDADALNIISENPQLLQQLPPNSILTPHPKEFERLFGPSANDFARLELAKAKAREWQIIIILKMGITFIACPDGNVFFNTKGNPGMGTAGAGDVLTGMITGLLAQPYTPVVASLLGVYLHAWAGDIAAEQSAAESLMAGDITQHIGYAYCKLKSYV